MSKGIISARGCFNCWKKAAHRLEESRGLHPLQGSIQIEAVERRNPFFGSDHKEFYPMIGSYRFGRVVVGGVKYTRDLIIFPDHVNSDWGRVEGHRLRVEDLKDVVAFDPEVLVVGTGAFGLMKVTDEAEKALAERGIQLVARKTAEACEVYNELMREGKKAVAALHLTC